MRRTYSTVRSLPAQVEMVLASGSLPLTWHQAARTKLSGELPRFTSMRAGIAATQAPFHSGPSTKGGPPPSPSGRAPSLGGGAPSPTPPSPTLPSPRVPASLLGGAPSLP